MGWIDDLRNSLDVVVEGSLFIDFADGSGLRLFYDKSKCKSPCVVYNFKTKIVEKTNFDIIRTEYEE